ncbi:hypothetical protein PITCH_A80002 [uncultured Desulfobacterium sp.]|uniref:Uncharacterized protein n=1 Tax=uncultured Desulfobacterium sp. TaxID=201089 RepID=A0A445MTP1_9BACT|nr:hypothetical protein PITCH_A1540005 [uncultured Desulfobacterium sp.]SPD76007.1 hypothetical protein PITCH_A80002 [uncultured Desulfobacterium sp.]
MHYLHIIYHILNTSYISPNIKSYWANPNEARRSILTPY